MALLEAPGGPNIGPREWTTLIGSKKVYKFSVGNDACLLSVGQKRTARKYDVLSHCTSTVVNATKTKKDYIICGYEDNKFLILIHECLNIELLDDEKGMLSIQIFMDMLTKDESAQQLDGHLYVSRGFISSVMETAHDSELVVILVPDLDTFVRLFGNIWQRC